MSDIEHRSNVTTKTLGTRRPWLLLVALALSLWLTDVPPSSASVSAGPAIQLAGKRTCKVVKQHGKKRRVCTTIKRRPTATITPTPSPTATPPALLPGDWTMCDYFHSCHPYCASGMGWTLCAKGDPTHNFAPYGSSITAATNRALDGTGYGVAIYANSALVKACTVGTTCTGAVLVTQPESVTSVSVRLEAPPGGPSPTVAAHIDFLLYGD